MWVLRIADRVRLAGPGALGAALVPTGGWLLPVGGPFCAIAKDAPPASSAATIVRPLRVVIYLPPTQLKPRSPWTDKKRGCEPIRSGWTAWNMSHLPETRAVALGAALSELASFSATLQSLQRFASAAARQIINLPAGSIVGCALAEAGLLFEASVTQFRLNIPRLFDGTRMAGGRRFMRDRKKREVAGLNRRAFVVLIPGAAIGFAGCTTRPAQQVYLGPTRQDVTYVTREKPGTIVVDPANHFLYLVEKGGQAVQYQVGVGKEGYGWSGIATVHDKQQWPDWYPTQDILDRKPEIRKYMVQLRSGYGMHGGPENPLGARALYLWQGRVDTLYRIHGTNEPESVGHDVSAGCIRMRNDDVTDLYDRTKVGTKVVVLTGHSV